MTRPPRSATLLVEKALANPQTLEALRRDPAQALKAMESEVLAELPVAPDRDAQDRIDEEGVAGRLWLILNCGFALVVLFAAWVLSSSVANPLDPAGVHATGAEAMRTVFPAVLGFLAGLLAPSLVRKDDR